MHTGSENGFKYQMHCFCCLSLVRPLTYFSSSKPTPLQPQLAHCASQGNTVCTSHVTVVTGMGCFGHWAQSCTVFDYVLASRQVKSHCLPSRAQLTKRGASSRWQKHPDSARGMTAWS
jgi:hypothetical protein